LEFKLELAAVPDKLKLELEHQRVARHHIEEDPSDYYPPRARWYGGLFSLWFKVQRLLHLEKIHLPVGVTIQQTILSLILPGYAFFANGRRMLGWVFVGVYVISAILFIVALGYQTGSLGYGLMISAHASSIIFLERFWLRAGCNFGLRLVLAIMTLLAVWLAVYAPATRFVEAHLVMPLRMRGNVVIVQRLTPPAQIRRGEWIMYSFKDHSVGNAHREGGAVRLRAGYGWGPVLATAGDRVDFSTNSFSVNGVVQPLLPHMPTSGEMVVLEKHWFIWPEKQSFIWPELGIVNAHINVSEANLAALMLQMATVSEAAYVGKSFQHWFGRKQHLYEPVQ
jgi:hypothetical protein